MRSKSRVGISGLSRACTLASSADQVAACGDGSRLSACSIAFATFSGGIPRSAVSSIDLAVALDRLAVERFALRRRAPISSAVRSPRSQIGVSIEPGSTIETEIPQGRSSWRKTSPTASIPNLAAW